MIIASAGAVLLLAAISAKGDIADAALLSDRNRAVLDIFFKACGSGSVKLKAKDVQPIDTKQLPNPLRDYYPGNPNLQSYKLFDDSSFLVMYKRENARGYRYSEACALASSDLPMLPAYDYVLERILGKYVKSPANRNSYRMAFIGPNSDYEISVQRVGKRLAEFTIVQTSLYNPQMILREKKENEKRRALFEKKSRASSWKSEHHRREERLRDQAVDGRRNRLAPHASGALT